MCIYIYMYIHQSSYVTHIVLTRPPQRTRWTPAPDKAAGAGIQNDGIREINGG